jgi:hypothetical protein
MVTLKHSTEILFITLRGPSQFDEKSEGVQSKMAVKSWQNRS